MRDTVIYNQNFETGERFEKHIQKNGLLTKIEIDVIDNKTGKVIETAYTENDINYKLFNQYHPGYRSLLNNIRMDTVQKVTTNYNTFSGRIELWDSEDTSPEQPVFKRQIIGWSEKESTYSGNSDKQGTYNNAESIKDYANQTATYVYDWPTHAANGTFNTICYTPAVSGFFTGLASSAYYRNEKTYYMPLECQSGCAANEGLSCIISGSENKLNELGGCPTLILGDEAYYFLWASNNRESMSFRKYNFKTNNEITTHIINGISGELCNFCEVMKIAYDYSDGYVYIILTSRYFSETGKMYIYRLDLANGSTDAELVASPTLRNCLAPPHPTNTGYQYTCDSYIHSIEWFNGLCKVFYRYGDEKGNADAIFNPFTERLIIYCQGTEKWRYIKKIGKLTIFNNAHIFNMNTLTMDENVISMHIRSNPEDSNYINGYIENNRNTIIQWDLDRIGSVPRSSVMEYLYGGVFSLAKLSKPVTKTPDNTLKIKYTFKAEKVYPNVKEVELVGSANVPITDTTSIEKLNMTNAIESKQGYNVLVNSLSPMITDKLITPGEDNRYTITQDKDLCHCLNINFTRAREYLSYGIAPGIDLYETFQIADTESNQIWNVNRGYYRFRIDVDNDNSIHMYTMYRTYSAGSKVAIHVTNSKTRPNVDDPTNRQFYKEQGFHENASITLDLKKGTNYIHCTNTVSSSYDWFCIYDIHLTNIKYGRVGKALLLKDNKLITRTFANADMTLQEFNTRYIKFTLDSYYTQKGWNNLFNYLEAKVGLVDVSKNKKAWGTMEDDRELASNIQKMTTARGDKVINGMDSIIFDLGEEYNLTGLRTLITDNGEKAYAKLEISRDGKYWYIVRHCDDQTYTCNQAEHSGSTQLKKYVWAEQEITDLETELESIGTYMTAYDANNYLAEPDNETVDIYKPNYGMISDVHYHNRQMITFNNYTAPSEKTISGFALETTCHSKSINFIASFDNGTTWNGVENDQFKTVSDSYEDIFNYGFVYSSKNQFQTLIENMLEKPKQIKIKIITKNYFTNTNRTIDSISYLTV